jgi:uncharacterized membrane-anchored protein YhcB (DUF1043 family)
MISLDGTASTWVFGILVFAIGLALGCMATYLAVARYGRTRELQKELNQLKDHFTDYRDQVTRHFMRTSELVQEMTQSYRAVYEHLANGAQHLCGDENDVNLLEASGKDQLTDASQDAAAGRAPDYLVEEVDPEDLMGDSPRISDLDIKSQAKTQQPLQH